MHKIYLYMPRPSSLWGQLRACLLTHHSITGAKHVTCSYRRAFYDFKHENTRMRGEKLQKAKPLPPVCLAGAVQTQPVSPWGLQGGGRPQHRPVQEGSAPPQAGEGPGGRPGLSRGVSPSQRGQAPACSPPPRRRALQLPACLARRTPLVSMGGAARGTPGAVVRPVPGSG